MVTEIMLDLTMIIISTKNSLRLPVIIAGSIGLLDVEHFHIVGALVGDGTDRSTAGDVIAVTVA